MRKLITTLFVVAVFVSACDSQSEHIPAIPSSTSKPSIVATSTQTLVQPTWTLKAAPTTMPTPKLDRIAIPKWVSDPDADVLLLPMGDHLQYNNFALVNSSSGEVYNLPEFNHGDYFWMSDGKHFGILSENESEILLVDIASGEITYHHPSEKAVQFVNVDTESTYAYKSIGKKVEDPEFVLVHSWWDISPDNHYFILEDPYDERYTRVLDLQTNETITVTDKDDMVFDLSRAWSPSEPYLGIVHSDEEPGMGFSFEKDPNFRLKIYDIEHGNVIGSYKNIPAVNWSPDGTKFLYQPWEESPHDHDFLHHGNPPCTFDTLTGITKCYNEAVVRHTTNTTYELTFSSMQWSPDGKMIGYIYFRIEHTPYEPYYEERGGICLITIEDNSIKCMLEEFEKQKQYLKPIAYWWSPSSEYVAFCVDESCPYCDFSNDPKIGILNINTGKSFIVGENVESRYRFGAWRPKIVP